MSKDGAASEHNTWNIMEHMRSVVGTYYMATYMGSLGLFDQIASEYKIS